MRSRITVFETGAPIECPDEQWLAVFNWEKKESRLMDDGKKRRVDYVAEVLQGRENAGYILNGLTNLDLNCNKWIATGSTAEEAIKNLPPKQKDAQ